MTTEQKSAKPRTRKPKAEPAETPPAKSLREELAAAESESIAAASSLATWLRQNDVRLWLEEVNKPDAFRIARDCVGAISFELFEIGVENHCLFFCQFRKLQQRTNAVAWTSAEWDALADHVSPFLNVMRSLTLLQCERLLRCFVSTSDPQLLGLPKRFRVWTDAANPKRYNANEPEPAAIAKPIRRSKKATAGSSPAG